MSKLRVAFVSVVPSPYQRDLFGALAKRPEIALDVYYLEAASPDSPWPEKPLAEYEHILPGFWMPAGGARLHANWHLPDLRKYDIVVMNSLISFTAQWLMRFRLKNRPWYFWGERLAPRRAGLRQAARDFIAAPLHGATGIAGIGTRAEADYREKFPAVFAFLSSLLLRSSAVSLATSPCARFRRDSLFVLRADDREKRRRFAY